MENSQYMRLDIKYIGEPLIIPGSELFLLYSGRDYYFTGKQIENIWFTSLELSFGKFYKTQISPFIEDNVDGLYPWSGKVKTVMFNF